MKEQELKNVLDRMEKMGSERAPSIILDKCAVDLLLDHMRDMRLKIKTYDTMCGPLDCIPPENPIYETIRKNWPVEIDHRTA